MNYWSGHVIPKPGDYHVHLRDGKMLERVLPDTARDFSRALVMPNLKEPVWDANSLTDYRDRILAVSPPGFQPLMAIYLTEKTTPEIILEAGKAGAVAAKYYPRDGTTNASHGLTPHRLFERVDWMEALVQAGMVLCLHAEDAIYPNKLVREYEFLKQFMNSRLADIFPRLRIVIEHASTSYALDVCDHYKNVAVTITVHHLLLTTSDVIGDHDCLCMPVAKSEDHRMALNRMVIGGMRRCFFGSDSAPHPRTTKERAQGSYGLYTTPVALPLLAKLFAENGSLQGLSDFVSGFGAEWYGLPESNDTIELVPEPWVVPDPSATGHDPDAIRPFYAGRSIHWSVRHNR